MAERKNPEAPRKGRSGPSGPSGANKQPRYTFRSADLDAYREAARQAGEDLNTWLNKAAQRRLRSQLR